MATLIIGGASATVDPKQYEFVGWKLSKGLVPSPYVKANGPLSAQFLYVVTIGGVDYEASHIRIPSMVAFTEKELRDYDHSRASLHIPRELCEKGLKKFAAEERRQNRAIKKEMNEAARITGNVVTLQPKAHSHHTPQLQMAAAIPGGPKAEMA